MLALVGASLAWLVIAPVYAVGLGIVARLVLPQLEGTPGTRYVVDGTRVLVYRPVWVAAESRLRERVDTVWAASANFGMPVFVALVLATPGWSYRLRARGLVGGLLILTVTQAVTMMVTAEFWQQLPIQGPDGRILHLPGHSTVRWQVAAVLYNFWEIMGRGFFALLVYFALLVSFTASPGRARPNDPCPCGSGRKFKRCCARQAVR